MRIRKDGRAPLVRRACSILPDYRWKIEFELVDAWASGPVYRAGAGKKGDLASRTVEEERERRRGRRQLSLLKGPRPSALRAGTPSRVYRVPFCLVFLPPCALSRALSTSSRAFRVRIFVLWRRSWIWESSRKTEKILIRWTLFLRLGDVVENQVSYSGLFFLVSFLLIFQSTSSKNRNNFIRGSCRNWSCINTESYSLLIDTYFDDTFPAGCLKRSFRNVYYLLVL